MARHAGVFGDNGVMSNHRKGDRFRVRHDWPTHAAVIYGAPVTGGFDCVVPEGAVLRIDQDVRPGSTGFWATLERYEDFERLLVPPEILADAEYDHFVFAVGADDVAAHLDELTGHA
jgi:hypothetical protein